MGYRINKVPDCFGYGDSGHKFVIVKEGEDFVYYAKTRGSLSNLDYSDLIKEYNLENIIATGLVDHGGGGKECLGIWPGSLDSQDFLNPASHELMKNFEEILLEKYREICPEIKMVLNLCARR